MRDLEIAVELSDGDDGRCAFKMALQFVIRIGFKLVEWTVNEFVAFLLDETIATCERDDLCCRDPVKMEGHHRQSLLVPLFLCVLCAYHLLQSCLDFICGIGRIQVDISFVVDELTRHLGDLCRQGCQDVGVGDMDAKTDIIIGSQRGIQDHLVQLHLAIEKKKTC